MKYGENTEQQQLVRWLLRVPKDQAAFTYFQLEANEGLCFYSTMDSSVGEGHRDILIMATLEFEDDVLHIIETLRKQYPIEILENKIVNDSLDVANISA